MLKFGVLYINSVKQVGAREGYPNVSKGSQVMK
jgi:hypothetical protein